jgi:hypothetical protein
VGPVRGEEGLTWKCASRGYEWVPSDEDEGPDPDAERDRRLEDDPDWSPCPF